MTTAQLKTNFTKETFEAFLAQRNEPDWVTAKRRNAFAEFETQSAIGLDPEEYKRVDLRRFREEQFQLAEQDCQPPEFNTLMQDRAEFGGSISHVNGRCVSTSELASSLKEKGVLFGDLSQLLQTDGDVLKPHFLTTAVQAETDRFSAWHAAFWTGGTVLYVPRNVEIDIPLYSLIGIANAGTTDLSHTLVILEEGASATLLEETASATDDTGLHIGAVELLVGAGANLRYVQLQNWNTKTFHFAHQSGRVARNGNLQWTVGGLGSKLSHIHQDIHLDGPGADAQVNGVTFALDKQVLSYYTQQTHHAPNTHSDLLYKEVVRDKARAIWRGMIKVDPDAQLTDGYQRNDALVLSSDARIDAIPGLEIEADDVRCTHGATAGQVDEEQVLYCMSRGLTRYEAMHIIVNGFFQQIFDRIPVEIVRETLAHTVEQKLDLG